MALLSLASTTDGTPADGWRGFLTGCVAVLALFAPALTIAAGSDAAEVSEVRVKAAFLYKFGSYVDWPPEVFPRPDSPFVIGIADAEPVAEELARVVEGRTLNGRPVTVKRLRRGDPLSGLQILFLGADEPLSRELLDQAQGKPILTVAESEMNDEQRSILKFVIDDSKIRFEVSLGAAQKNGLRLSSQLLAVARQVRGGSP